MIKKRLNRTLFFFILIFFICLHSAFSQSVFVKTIYFKSNSFAIDKKYENTLNLVAKQLRSNTFGYLKIFGYSDSNGPDNYNEALSKKRANAVYNYLVYRANFDRSRVYVEWLGESGESYDLHFPEAHIQQRCVDIWIQFSKK